MGLPNLEATFETLVDAFVFLDKNKDGYVSKNETVQAINESGERSSGRIAMKRFGYFSLLTLLTFYGYSYSCAYDLADTTGMRENKKTKDSFLCVCCSTYTTMAPKD